MVVEYRLQIRTFEIEGGWVEEYRWARENGWCGPWRSTPLLALDAMRRVAKAGR